MELLNEKGCDRFCKRKDGTNALHLAVKKSNKEMINMLMRMGFPIDEPKKNGYTALTIAVFEQNAEIVKLLISYRANVNLRT